MALTITSNLILSDGTEHTATGQDGTWQVSWLPGRALNHSQAITAMLLAEKASQGVGLSDDPAWIPLEELAAQLGTSAAMAVARASERPGDTAG